MIQFMDVNGIKQMMDISEPFNKTFNADCMTFLKACPDKAFELCVCDPPYGISADKFNNGAGAKNRIGKESTAKTSRKISSCSWDDEPPTEEYFEEIFRVSQNQVIWGGNYFRLPPTRGIIVWDKMQPWENFSQVELAWTSFDRPAALFKYCNSGYTSATGIKKWHPTQKPKALYDWIYQKFAKSGDKVLDTHLGSGTNRLAAYDAGLSFVGLEINQEYFNKEEKQFEEYTAQINIFTMEQEGFFNDGLELGN